MSWLSGLWGSRTAVGPVVVPEKKMCSICDEEVEARSQLVSFDGRYVHKDCDLLITPAVRELNQQILKIFKSGNDDRTREFLAAQRAAQTVRAVCDARTLKECFEKKGIETLTRLFNSVGVEAAKVVSLELSPGK